jgi:chorismate-pyruvate lyase
MDLNLNSYSILSLNNLNDDEFLVNFFMNNNSLEKFKIENLNNKLWKCFMTNDGSITKMLTMLLDNKLKLDLKYHKSFVKEDKEFQDLSIDNKILNLIEKLCSNHIKASNLINRKINFKNEKGITIMIGISIWNEDEYERIYDKDEYSKPIGLIIREKEIEFYHKITTNILPKVEDNVEIGFILLRSSYYKMKGEVKFILLEIFDCDIFEENLGILK